MKYILDFDRTLFAVERLYSALEAANAAHTAGTKESFAVAQMENYVYEDVRQWLQGKPKEDVYIVSSASGTSREWETDYQTEKIMQSGIGDLVSAIEVIRGNKGQVVAEIATQFPPPEPIIFVDDRIEQCLSVQAAAPRVVCCLMVRDRAVIGDVKVVQGMSVVHDLSGVDAIIESL